MMPFFTDNHILNLIKDAVESGNPIEFIETAKEAVDEVTNWTKEEIYNYYKENYGDEELQL